MTRGFDESYIKTLIHYREYVIKFKICAANDIEMFKLSKYISILENPPAKYFLGTRVKHNCSTTHEYGVVDDYDYTVNQYQIVYDNGSTVGLIPEKDLSIINE
jgi:hypothetical protein